MIASVTTSQNLKKKGSHPLAIQPCGRTMQA